MTTPILLTRALASPGSTPRLLAASLSLLTLLSASPALASAPTAAPDTPNASSSSATAAPDLEPRLVAAPAPLADEPQLQRTSPDLRPRRDGHVMYGVGVGLLSVGLTLAAAAGGVAILCPECRYLHLPLALVGVGSIIPGGLAIASGTTRRRAFRQAWGIPVAKARLMPTFSAGRRGAQVGIVMRF